MSASNFYLRQEAKKGFKDWTKEGLEFLLQKGGLEVEVERKCQKRLNNWVKK